MSVQADVLATRGGGWLLAATEPSTVFSADRFTEEHKLISQTADEFMSTEVLPNIDRLEQKDWAFARQLLRQCGDLGLLGADTPEAYGGVHLDKVSSLILSERLALSASFATSYGAQVNLALLAILLFGTEAQKRKYAPKLVSAELIGAYGLSESGAGSDALAAKTRATRQADGSFVVTGEKMWISNGGFADLYIVFAKVDGEHFTAFIVERAFPGVSSGKEEHKMGLLGSSTTSVLLQDVRVPAENVLGEVGKGHRVAFNVLNFGRLKLGFMCNGGAMAVIGESARYAATRQQFGHPIASFGAIKHKIGEMSARTYALESMLYRTAGLLDAFITERQIVKEDMAAVLAAGEEYAIEASIAKVAGSEVAEFVLDENVQIHGGNGFVHDYPAERHYRDARVNRIFEGTNEINRLLIPGILMKRAIKGDLPIFQAAKQLQAELMGPPQMGAKASGGLLADEQQTVASLKKVALAVMGVGMLRHAEKLADEQEVMMSMADILIDTYQAESAVLRALDASSRSLPNAGLQQDAAQVFVHDAVARVDLNARQALAALADGDMLRTHLAALRRLLKPGPVNTIALRRRLADATVAKGGYLFR
ncbi:MAG: acyl-CoA dehydrogenase family protein [Acidobacteriota bacterium]